jgi:RHS repeat-associated protein
MTATIDSTNNSVIADYTYDALGRRNSKSHPGVFPPTTTIYVTDPDGREVLEFSGTTGATSAWYAYGPGPNDVLNEMEVQAGSHTTMIPDIQGSIVGLLPTSGPPVITKAGYEPYGENPTTTSGTFRYTGQRFDAETAGSSAEPSGLYYYRSRVYSPALGRFLQPDTIGYQDNPVGLNLYAYVDNDPLNNTDPKGYCYPECSVPIGAAIGGAIGGGAYVAYNWNDLTWSGFFARTAQGATVGALAGAGYELPLLAAIGASANVTASFVQQASEGTLQSYYGVSVGQNTAQVLEDATIGGLSVYAGQAASNVLTPIVNDAFGALGANVLANESVNNTTAAIVISTINSSNEPVLQGSETLGDVGFEYLSDWATEALSHFSVQNVPSGSTQLEK